MERRNFIRALIAVTIGVPIAIEGVTFSKLFYERLVGSEPAPRRPEDGGIGVGDQLLPATDPTETIAELSLEGAGESEWRFRLVVDVENTAETTYRLKVGPLSLTDGSTVGETVSTGVLQAGESTTVEGEWLVPRGSDVEAVWVGGSTGDEHVTERVVLEPLDQPT